MTTESNNDLQAALDRDRAAAGDNKPADRLETAMAASTKPAWPVHQPAAKAVAATGTAAVITAASLRADNNAKLNAIADERKAITGEIAGIDEQMNALLDRRSAAIARMGEIAQAEAMIRAAQTVGNAPRWTQG